MKTITLPTCKLLIVPRKLLYNANRFQASSFLRCFRNNYKESDWVTDVKIPVGNWIPLGFKNDITEDQAKGIVAPLHNIEDGEQYEDFSQSKIRGFTRAGLATAIESFHSLMQANGVTDNELILIEKI